MLELKSKSPGHPGSRKIKPPPLLYNHKRRLSFPVRRAAWIQSSKSTSDLDTSTSNNDNKNN
eukprot:Pgem_evm2s2727